MTPFEESEQFHVPRRKSRLLPTNPSKRQSNRVSRNRIRPDASDDLLMVGAATALLYLGGEISVDAGLIYSREKIIQWLAEECGDKVLK